MCRCPACRERIPFGTLFLAPLPSHIKCPACGIALVGNRFIRWQGRLKVTAALAGSVAVLWWVTTDIVRPLERVLAFLGIALLLLAVVGVPLAMLARRLGRYERR